MSYDASIEERVDEAIAGWGADTAKKKMFGADNLEDPAFTELLETGWDYALSLPPK